MRWVYFVAVRQVLHATVRRQTVHFASHLVPGVEIGSHRAETRFERLVWMASGSNVHYFLAHLLVPLMPMSFLTFSVAIRHRAAALAPSELVPRFPTEGARAQVRVVHHHLAAVGALQALHVAHARGVPRGVPRGSTEKLQ